MKKKYGQVAAEHHAKNLALEDDVIEYRREMEPSILENVKTTVQAALVAPQYAHKDFYVVLLFKVEKIGQSPRTYVFARMSCPTPVYKQSVWKYHRASGNLEFLWCIPDLVLYHHIVRNAATFLADPETAQLAQFVILMESGEMLAWAKRENGEKIDAVIRTNGEDACLTT